MNIKKKSVVLMFGLIALGVTAQSSERIKYCPGNGPLVTFAMAGLPFPAVEDEFPNQKELKRLREIFDGSVSRIYSDADATEALAAVKDADKISSNATNPASDIAEAYRIQAGFEGKLAQYHKMSGKPFLNLCLSYFDASFKASEKNIQAAYDYGLTVSGIFDQGPVLLKTFLKSTNPKLRCTQARTLLSKLGIHSEADVAAKASAGAIKNLGDAHVMAKLEKGCPGSL